LERGWPGEEERGDWVGGTDGNLPPQFRCSKFDPKPFGRGRKESKSSLWRIKKPQTKKKQKNPRSKTQMNKKKTNWHQGGKRNLEKKDNSGTVKKVRKKRVRGRRKEKKQQRKESRNCRG